MTDKEIIKALECHTEMECGNCPYDKGLVEPCIAPMVKDALDLINRQQAEIERLTDKNKRLGEGVSWLLNNENGIELIRDEAIKEFAEKVEKELEQTMKALFYVGETLVEVSKSHLTESRAIDKIRDYLQGTISSRSNLNKIIDNIVKEMTESR